MDSLGDLEEVSEKQSGTPRKVCSRNMPWIGGFRDQEGQTSTEELQLTLPRTSPPPPFVKNTVTTFLRTTQTRSAWLLQSLECHLWKGPLDLCSGLRCHYREEAGASGLSRFALASPPRPYNQEDYCSYLIMFCMHVCLSCSFFGLSRFEWASVRAPILWLNFACLCFAPTLVCVRALCLLVIQCDFFCVVCGGLLVWLVWVCFVVLWGVLPTCWLILIYVLFICVVVLVALVLWCCCDYSCSCL